MNILSKFANRYQVERDRALQDMKFKPLETELQKDNWLSKAMSSVRKFFTGKKHSITYQDRLNRVLEQACSGCDIKHITYLLDRGADAHLTSPELLFMNVSKSTRSNEITKFLISRGANIHEDEESVLRVASLHGDPELVRIMLDMGCDIHAKNDYAIKAASSHNYGSSEKACPSQKHSEIISLLLIDFNMTIKHETKIWLEKHSCTEALEILAMRDLKDSLESTLTPKQEAKSKKMKI